jgi:pyridoxal phosphate enzyme (YggS family)
MERYPHNPDVASDRPVDKARAAELRARLAAVRARVAEAESRAGRTHGSVTLLAVSKTFSAADIRAAYAAGQQDFGESYLQEAIAKMAALGDCAIRWHFIGPIQSNKTRAIAERFDWVHSVDRERIARRLAAQRPVELAPLDVCLQVRIGEENTKSGVDPRDVAPLARAVAELPRLRLRGLMTIPPPNPDETQRRVAFRQLAQLRSELVSAGLSLDTLSMGMTEDMAEAIAEGATLVRVGGGIFGSRPPAGVVGDPQG